jgi:hypothetical protein
MVTTTSVSSREYYAEYSGHKVRHLRLVHDALRASTDRLLWTAGDSSLDNKYWFHDTAPAIGPMATTGVLRPPVSKLDVTHWLNEQCVNHAHNNNRSNHRLRTAAINTAVEASTLNERTFALRPQDVFIRNHIQENDILVVSVGGNDVALAPCPCTIIAMLSLIFCLPRTCVERGCSVPGFGAGIPVDDCCCGCGPSLCSCASACPPCAGYFHHLFGMRVQKYVERLVSKTKPSKVLVCMIYNPDEYPHPGWASPVLGILGYNRNPAKLQALIRNAFEQAVSSIHIPGTRVIPVPLFAVLDGKNTSDYVQRVEPSPSGGRKMAQYIWSLIVNDDDDNESNNNNNNNQVLTTATTTTTVASSSLLRLHAADAAAPSTALIQERD